MDDMISLIRNLVAQVRPRTARTSYSSQQYNAFATVLRYLNFVSQPSHKNLTTECTENTEIFRNQMLTNRKKLR